MNNLLKVDYNDERITLSARDLHEFLEVKTNFKDWFPRMCEYGFEQSVDFNMLKIERVQFEGTREVKREITDYQITIDMAKEIAMLQRNERGKQARQYFIELEKQWNSPEMVMKRALEIANKKVKLLETENEQLKPKALFADCVSASESCCLIGELAKVLKANGMEIGQNRLFQMLRDMGYLISRKGDSFNQPTQKSMELEIMRIKKRTITNSDGTVRVTNTTVLTPKGIQYFVNKFINNNKKEIKG